MRLQITTWFDLIANGLVKINMQGKEYADE